MTHGLTEAELRYAAMIGMSPERYAALKTAADPRTGAFTVAGTLRALAALEDRNRAREQARQELLVEREKTDLRSQR